MRLKLACATAAFAHPRSTMAIHNSLKTINVQQGEDCENEDLIQQADFNKVVPLPATITQGKGFFSMNAKTVITCTPTDDMKRNAAFLAQYVKDVTGMALSVGTKGSTSIALVLAPKPKASLRPRLTASLLPKRASPSLHPRQPVCFMAFRPCARHFRASAIVPTVRRWLPRCSGLWLPSTTAHASDIVA